MWLVKQAASKVKSLSQAVLKEKGEAVRLAQDVVSNRHEVMPVRKMGELAALSFDMDCFQQTVDFIVSKLTDIKFQRKSLKKRLNILVLSTYLLKHGASGFIDQLRSLSPELRRYQSLRNFLAEEDSEMSRIMQDLRDRAAYLLTLLGDKGALLREKEVARLVKEKLFIQGGDYSTQRRKAEEGEDAASTGDRVEAFLEHYVWRYTQRLDRKLDEITDILIAKIDEYLDGDMPEQFEIDEAQTINTKPALTRSEFQFGGKEAIKVEAGFVEGKLQVKEGKASSDLLDLAEVVKKAPADLLQFEEEKGKENQAEQANKLQVINPIEDAASNKVMDDQEIQAFRSELTFSNPSP